jgi:hypothetical protein
MRLNCCQKAAIFSLENDNTLQDLPFLGFDEPVSAKRGENLPNRGSRLENTASARARNGRHATADHLLARDCDVQTTHGAKLPAHALNRSHEPPPSRCVAREIQRLSGPRPRVAGSQDAAGANGRRCWRRHAGALLHGRANERLDRLIVKQLLLRLASMPTCLTNEVTI